MTSGLFCGGWTLERASALALALAVFVVEGQSFKYNGESIILKESRGDTDNE
jgi:hypothetical protein